MGVMPIPCPHFKISIVKRSQGQSAVAGAAYQSGERLFSEYDQKTKFYNKKKELVHSEIMLPPHAPPGYADRATLWNAVEAVENQWNSQLARRIVLALPREVPKDQYVSMLKEFCKAQFVSKGMIADFAIHDKDDGNPHAHILLTIRAMDEHGKWLPKARKVYDLDENGERIKLPSGNWKSHKENSLNTVEDLNAAIKDLSQAAAPLRKQLKQNENRMREIAQVKDAAAIHAKLKPIHDTFIKKNFKLTKDAYASQHKDELDTFNKAVRTLMKLNGSTTVDFSALDAEFSALQSGSAELRSQLETMRPDLTALKNVRKYIDLVLNKQQLSAPGGKAPEKESVLKQLEQLQQEKSKHKTITTMNREESL